MPSVAAWVDELRVAFGAEAIDQAMREGIADARAGQRDEGFRRAGFWARENGETVGAPVCAPQNEKTGGSGNG